MKNYTKTLVSFIPDEANGVSHIVATIVTIPKENVYVLERSALTLLPKKSLSKNDKGLVLNYLDSIESKIYSLDAPKNGRAYKSLLLGLEDSNFYFDTINVLADSIEEVLQNSSENSIGDTRPEASELSQEGDLSQESVNEQVDNVTSIFANQTKGEARAIPNYPIDDEPNAKRELLDTFVETGFQVAELFDKVLETVTGPILEKLHDDAEIKAMQDPIYAEIEKKRSSAGRHHVLYSEDMGLGTNELKIQREILNSHRKNPWWENSVRFLSSSPLTGFLHKGKWAVQRLSRGWDDTELYSLDSALTKRIGEQLITLAHVGHGWPGEENGYDTQEDWDQALHYHGMALLEYSSLDRYGVTGVLPDYDEKVNQARHALVWVAENLEALWD